MFYGGGISALGQMSSIFHTGFLLIKVLVNISKKLLVVAVEGYYRAVYNFLCYKQMSPEKKKRRFASFL